MVRSIDETAQGLGEDGARLAAGLRSSSAALRGAQRGHAPADPPRAASTRCAWPASGSRRRRPATLLARALEDPAGAGAVRRRRRPRIRPLGRPMSSSVGCALIGACHALRLAGRQGRLAGRSPTRSPSVLAEHGGRIETGRHGALARPSCPTPTRSSSTSRRGAVAEIAGERLPARVARAYRRYRHGPGAFKVDLAVEGGVPWTNEACRRAGTVHVGGHVRGARRRRASDQPRAGCPSGPSCWSASSTSPIPSARTATSIRSGPTPTCRTATPGTRPRPCSARSSASPRASASGSSASSIRLAGRARRLQRQLRRRGHHHRRQHAGPGPDPAALRARPLQHRHRRRLHLLGRDAAGRRRPRHERVQRRPLRAAAPRLRCTYP